MQNSAFNRHLSPISPVITAHLFPDLAGQLIALLRGLSPEQWNETAVKEWTVKDVVAHLLDTSLRRLSMGRDGHWGESFTGSTPAEFKQFLHKLNYDFVAASRRVSPRVLCDLLENAERELSAYVAALDPHKPALFGVSWAGQDSSQNWFDIAREYTEKWHHQQQIRDAVGKPGILTPELGGPVLETFVYALPVAYRSTKAAKGTTVGFHVEGAITDHWTLVASDQNWELMKGAADTPDCLVVIEAESAWKLFTNGLDADEARRKARVSGDAALAVPFYTVRAIAT